MTAATALVKKEDVRGLKRLARYYEQGIGVQPNKELHKDYVLKAAATKDPEALVEKARLLIKGEDMEPDPKTAMDILTKLEQNQTHAVPGMYFLLGYLHEEGLGTPQDMALAYQFYIKGAEQDDAKSMNNLGSMYERGTGVAKDLAEARKWYEQAAELGNEDARANVERVKEKIKKKAGK
jgi:TPR repeat protein